MKSLEMNHLGRKILKSVLSFAIALQTPLAFAGDDAREAVIDAEKVIKRIPGTKAAFCLAVENGAVTGYNENDPVRTASVTKTLTTFWAVEALGPNFQYTTHVYVQPSNGEVHIQGQRDPFFDRDRLFSLLADLNRKNVTKINRLTVDSNFWFWPDATEFRYAGGGGGGGGRARKGHAGNGHAGKGKVAFRLAKGHPGKGHPAAKGHAAPRRAAPKGHRRHGMIDQPSTGRMPASVGNFYESEAHTDATIAGNMDKVKANIVAGFNTGGWSAGLKNRYARSRSVNPVLALPPSVQMSVGAVDVVPSNPLAGKPGVYHFVLKSAPIRMYLKKMNINSINSYAEEIFFSLGGKGRFEQFMQAKYGYGARVSNVNSGSGVNLHGGNRFDSMVSCSTVVTMIRKMDQDLEQKFHLDLSDVMMVPGHDGGTWHDASKSLIVKTGTLINPTASKNLAGVEETKEGEVYFGIFLDKRGGNSGNVQRILTAGLRDNFHGVPVKESGYAFQPIGAFTHMTLVGVTVKVAGR